MSLYPSVASVVSLRLTVFVPFCGISGEFGVCSFCWHLCTLLCVFFSIPWKDKIKLPVQVWLLVSFCWSRSSSRGACGGDERESELVPVWPLALPTMTARSCWTDLWRTRLTLSVRSATLTSLCPSVTSRHRWAGIWYGCTSNGVGKLQIMNVLVFNPMIVIIGVECLFGGLFLYFCILRCPNFEFFPWEIQLSFLGEEQPTAKLTLHSKRKYRRLCVISGGFIYHPVVLVWTAHKTLSHFSHHPPPAPIHPVC